MKLATVSVLAAILTSGCAAGRARGIEQFSGAELYEQLCASCHGLSGRGDGPVVRTGVPDLTRLAHRDGGEFPTADVQRVIDGRWDRRAHGDRNMPVWGWQLYDDAVQDDPAARARVDSMIDRLVNHLRSIQMN
jgi:mono/diheme cytochrome c family protein